MWLPVLVDRAPEHPICSDTLQKQTKHGDGTGGGSPDQARPGTWQLRAVLTDAQFWAPLLVLLAGLVLLVALH